VQELADQGGGTTAVTDSWFVLARKREYPASSGVCACVRLAVIPGIFAVALLGAACDVPHGTVASKDPAVILKERPYGLDAPPDTTTPSPLLVVLHGQGGSGLEIAQDLDLRPLVATRNFWLAMPDGTFNRAGVATWNAGTVDLPPYDRIYLAALIDEVAAKHAVDPKRVYVVGYSIGAFMAHRLACDVSPKLAAIMSFAGAVTSVASSCATTSPVSVVELHGDHDDVITYDGGPFVNGVQSSPSAHDTVATWARNDACTGHLLSTGVALDLDPDVAGSETAIDAYEGCPRGIDVQLWTMRGSGHSPNLTPGFAARVIDWLYAHPKP
jgi:polyhydroxybutyrate depolymerase